MPAYDYRCVVCNFEQEIIHSIANCDIVRVCSECGIGTMRRIISCSQHIEGSAVYPFEFWNIRTPDGKESMTINNKTEHKEVLRSKGLDSPFFHVGG